MKPAFSVLLVLLLPASLGRIVSVSLIVPSTQLPLGRFVPFGQFAMYSNRDQPGRFNSTIMLQGDGYLEGAENRSGERVVMAVAPFMAIRDLAREVGEVVMETMEVCQWAKGSGAPPSFLQRLSFSSQPLTAVTNISTVLLTQSHIINETDLYDVFIAYCDGSARQLTIEGEIVLKNPYGYLPGEAFPLLMVRDMQFSFVAVCAHGLVLGLWAVLLYWHWGSAISLQKWYIPIVLFFSALEEACYYLSWDFLNTNGVSSHPLLISVLVLNSLRTTLSRILLLVVSMGYGITIPLLKAKKTVVALGVFFFVCNVTYVLTLHLPHWYAVRVKTVHLAVVTIPVSMVNSAFYFWISLELANTIRKLKRENQEFKLRIFQKLVILFSVAIVFAIVWFCVECFYRFFQDWEDYWQISWRLDAAWHAAFFVTILGVITLWRPTENSKSLAFTLELMDEEVSKSDITKKHAGDKHNFDIGYEGEGT